MVMGKYASHGVGTAGVKSAVFARKYACDGVGVSGGC